MLRRANETTFLIPLRLSIGVLIIMIFGENIGNNKQSPRRGVISCADLWAQIGLKEQVRAYLGSFSLTPGNSSLWMWVVPYGTVSGREAAVELIATYSQRVSKGSTRIRGARG